MFVNVSYVQNSISCVCSKMRLINNYNLLRYHLQLPLIYYSASFFSTHSKKSVMGLFLSQLRLLLYEIMTGKGLDPPSTC